MPISLQQLISPKVRLESASGQSIAIHRRLGSILFYSKDGIFETFQREGIESDSSWQRTGKWTLPLNNGKNNDESSEDFEIVSSLPVEAMSAFLIILISNGEASLLFLNAMNCSLICMSDISSVAQPICADIDQKRKELLIGFTDGSLVSFAMRLQQNINLKNNNDNNNNVNHHDNNDDKDNVKNDRSNTDNNDNMNIKNDQKLKQKVIQTILRKQININQVLGSDIESDKFSLFHIDHSNITGILLILSLEGNICCLETSTLKYLWILDRNLFKFCPIYLWMDQFGSGFVVLCSTKENTDRENNDKKNKWKFNDSYDSDNDNNEIQVLEYWKPPRNHNDAQSGLFNRVELPMNGRLKNLSIETVHPDLNVMIITISNFNHIQLFHEDEKDETLSIECSMSLNDVEVEINMNIEKNVQDNKEMKNNNAKGTNSNKNLYDERLRMELKKSLGLSSFLKSSFSLPDSPVVLLSTHYDNIDIIALHIPTLSDIINKRKCMFILASQIEIKNQPLSSPTKNNEFEEFIKTKNPPSYKKSSLISNSGSDMNFLTSVDNVDHTMNSKISDFDSSLLNIHENNDVNKPIGLKSKSIIGDILTTALSSAANDMISLTSSTAFLGEFSLDTEISLKNENEKKIKNEIEKENEKIMYERKISSSGVPLPFGKDMNDDQALNTPDKHKSKHKSKFVFE